MKITLLVKPYNDLLDMHFTEVADERYKGIKFGINYRIETDDGWKPIVRYDNHFHKGKICGHLHRIDKDWESPEYMDLDIEDAMKLVRNLGKTLRKVVIK